MIQVRHAQGYHNVAGDIDYNAYMSHDYVDAALTPLGWKQVISMLQLYPLMNCYLRFFI